MIDAKKVTWDVFFEALERKEGIKLRNGKWKRGDGGKAIGPFQIHVCYWQDSRVKFPYEQCEVRQYAERVVLGYMKRWERDAFDNLTDGVATIFDLQSLARAHNAGWNWRSDPPEAQRKSMAYWQEFENILEKVLEGKG